MKKMKIAIYLIATTCLVSTLFSCKKDNKETNDEEVITTLLVNLTPVGGGNALQFAYDDADGPGGNAPTKQTIALQPNKTYQVSLQLLNKTANPIADLTGEIVSEATAHRFYYQQTSGNNITISNLNKDGNNVSLGNTCTWSTSNSGNGKIKITLRHYASDPPNKDENDLVNSTKSATDVEVEFDTTVN
jgi:hypothetical protein